MAAMRVAKHSIPDVVQSVLFTHYAGCDGFFCTVPQVTPNRRRACWIAVFLTHEHSEKNERADANGSSPTPLDPFALGMLRNLAGYRTFCHIRKAAHPPR